MYISEIAPPAYRGRLAGMFQFNIVFGIIVAFASNSLLVDIGANAWRWMLGVAALPSLIYTVMCLGIPESLALVDWAQRRPSRGVGRVATH